MNVVTLKSGQTYVEEEREGGFTLVPAHVWIEDQVAPEEIALAFELLAGKRGTEEFRPFLHWLLGELREKYGDRWLGVIEAYLTSPMAWQLIAKMEIEDILKEGGQSL